MSASIQTSSSTVRSKSSAQYPKSSKFDITENLPEARLKNCRGNSRACVGWDYNLALLWV